ncbi:hypothetical protein L4C38_18210, partial [Vibrio kasasachensis]
RREWIKQKLYALSQVYCIDICAYAIMSNHYHLVVHINRDKAQALSNHEVVERWQQEHKLPSLVSRWLSGQSTSDAETEACMSIIDSWRSRLWSLSWFMKAIKGTHTLKYSKNLSIFGANIQYYTYGRPYY